MPEVNIEVAGRTYRVGCGDGEEAHLARLGRVLDAEALQLSRTIGQIPEGRLMLMTALMIADRLSDAEGQAQAAEQRAIDAENRAETLPDPSQFLTPERESEIARNLDSLAARIESLAERFETRV